MRTIALLLSTLVFGCGISDDLLMSDLTEDELTKLCGELASDDREITCESDGFEITIEISGSEEECVTDNDASYYDGCDVTVGDVRACNDAWASLSDEEICSLDTGFPSECDPLIECAFGG